MLPSQGNGVKAPGEIPGHLAAGKDLPDDGGQGRPSHAHSQAHDKQRVQPGVDDRTGEGADHGHLGAAVGPDQVSAAGGEHQEGEPQRGDAHIGPGIGQHLVRRPESPQQRGEKNLRDNAQHNSAHKQRRRRIAHIVGGPLPLSPAHGQVEGGGAADAEQQPQGRAQGGQGEGHICG